MSKRAKREKPSADAPEAISTLDRPASGATVAVEDTRSEDTEDTVESAAGMSTPEGLAAPLDEPEPLDEYAEAEVEALVLPVPGQGGQLDEETTQRLFRRLRGPLEGVRYGDRTALRDHLVLVHAPLVEHCARNFGSSGEPLEDLVQEGYVGLIKAVDRFNPDKGVRFSTYAYHLIGGEIRHYLRDLGKLIHEPGWHFELRQRVGRMTEQLTQKLSRAPQPEEIAEALNVQVDTVRNVLKNQNTLTVERLEGEGESEGEGGSGGSAREWDSELASATEPLESRVDDQMMLNAALPQLRDLEKRVVTMFFFEEHSKTEIARRLGISVNYAAYLIKRGLAHLREIIEQSDVVVAPPSQQQARAAYLLTQARSSASELAASTVASSTVQARERRAAAAVPAVPAVARSGVASFVEFVGWVDEEAQRAARYSQHFGLLWLQIRNWHEVTAGLKGAEVKRATTAIQTLTRRCCRNVDKVALLTTNSLPGLHLLVLMPHSGEQGERVGERWLESCRPEKVFPSNPAAVEGVLTKYAFALFPRDGKTSEDLFRLLGSRLGM